MRDPTNDAINPANSRADAGATPATGSRAALSLELQHLVADVEELVRQATSLTGEELAAAKVRLSGRLAAARGAMSRAGDSIATHARTTMDATNDYVHGQPWKAIGIGATLGLLLGFALARR